MAGKNMSRREFIKKTTNISAGSVLLYSTLSTKNKTFLGNAPSVSDVKKEYGIFDQRIFLEPGPEFRGVPLFFFNDKIDVDEVIWQLKSIHYAGWGSVMPRRYAGLLDAPYDLKWNEAIREILKVCKSLNMKVFLQEAEKNPVGYSTPTPIPGMKEEYRHKLLVRRNVKDKPEKYETLIKRIGNYTYYQHIVFPRAGYEKGFCDMDLLDPDVVNAYMKGLFEFFDTNFGYDLGKTIEAVWVAEPFAIINRVRNIEFLPWTPKLPEVFQKDWGYSLLDSLTSLFEEVGNFKKIRYNFWRTVGKLFVESHSKAMWDWCEKYNVKFSGHLMGEDTLNWQVLYSVNVMPHYEYMQLIGIDHLTMNLYWPTGNPFIVTPKQASSVANQLGRKEVLSEMYGTCDQGITFEERKRIADWLGLLGINYRCYHGSFYSLRGSRKRNYPPNLNYQQPYWYENRFIADYGGRLSYVLRQGKYEADILIIHPIESYYIEVKLDREAKKEVGPLDESLIKTSHNLLKIQRPYDYGDETILAKYGKVVKNIIAVGEMSYKVVIMPSIRILRESTFKLLTEFINAGGKVISVGELPTMINGEVDKQIDEFNKKVIKVENDSKALKFILDNIITSVVQLRSLNGISTEDIWIQHRIFDNGQMFFLINTSSERMIDVEVKIKGNGKLERWNLENGKVEVIPQQNMGEYISTKLQFVQGDSHLLFLNEKVASENIPESIGKILWQEPLKTFQVIRYDPNSMTLDFCKYRKGNVEWSEVLPIIGIQEILEDEKYVGPVTLRFEFNSEIKPNRCAVVIEDAKDCLVVVNGSNVEYEGLPYYRDKSFLPIDVTHQIKPGTNYIEIIREFRAPIKDTIDGKNLSKYYGTQLEQIYLIGDFAVKGERIGQDVYQVTRHRYKPDFTLIRESGSTNGDLLADGYCFFNGIINLTLYTFIKKINKDEKYYIDIERLEAVIAKVKVNNKDVGKLAWRPYRLEITDFVWEGENKIEIYLTNSLRNLTGTLHYVPLERFKFAGQWSNEVTPRVSDGQNWLEKRKNGTITTWSDDYFFRPFGLSGNVSIICEKFS